MTPIRYGSRFVVYANYPMARDALPVFEQFLQAHSNQVARFEPPIKRKQGIYPAFQPVVLETYDDNQKDWVGNRQQGLQVVKELESLLHWLGFRYPERTPYDTETLDKKYAPERQFFQTLNPIKWVSLLRWLARVDPKLEQTLRTTREWYRIYPPWMGEYFKQHQSTTAAKTILKDNRSDAERVQHLHNLKQQVQQWRDRHLKGQI
jgi:hypothetical protein